MGAGTLTATRDKSIEIDVSERYFTVYGTIALGAAAGDTYTADGVTLSFAGLTPGLGSSVPVEVRVWSETATLSIPVYVYDPGTTVANGKLLIYGFPGNAAGTAAGAEFANGTAWNDATLNIWGDVLRFSAKFRKGR